MKRAIVVLLATFILIGLGSVHGADCKKSGLELETATIDPGTFELPDLRAGCTLSKHWMDDSVLGYYSGFEAGMQTVLYFDPEECHTDATPMQITSLDLTLFDPPDAWDPRPRVWPVQIEVVVYDLLVSSDSCNGPGAELCRMPVMCDSSVFAFPRIGTVDLTLIDCCVDGPFFIGIEYISENVWPLPSLMFNTSPEVELCHMFQYYCGEWFGWHAFWPTPPGYPFLWVNGETQSLNCCPDLDSDGVCEDTDNCPSTANADQADADSDGVGDVCDNCPDDYNPGQEETDGDGFPDACDNCPDDYNVSQQDSDGDGIGDVCDMCPTDSTNDVDGDGVCGLSDNCPMIANPDQTDSDGDGTGDACELIEQCVGLRGNIDGFLDDDTDISDLVYLVDYMFNNGPPPPVMEEADVDASGELDISDLVYLVNWMFRAGPPPMPCP